MASAALRDEAYPPDAPLRLLPHAPKPRRRRLQQALHGAEGEGKVTLAQAGHVKNPFIYGFKQKFFADGMQRIASIPFVRNILEYTRGEDDPNQLTLTSLLHWKAGSASIDNAELDRIFNETFRSSEKKSWKAGTMPVIDLLLEQAEAALVAAEGIKFENKIALSIATRIVADQHMVRDLADPAFTGGITGNQTHALFLAFKSRGHGSADSLRALDDVVLMTPENIHANSFMYEPIIDLSDTALRDLYRRVKNLKN